MNRPSPGLVTLLPSLVREAKRRMLPLAGIFAVVALGALVVGMILPKTWECSAVLVPDTASIKSLVDHGGGAGAENRLAMMVQAVQTRRIRHEILEHGGWLKGHLSPQDEERLLNKLRSSLRVENVRDMIRVSYRDNDAKRTFALTQKMVEVLVREAANAKETASRETYEFIERQVKDYGSELTVVHDKLLAYYRSQGIVSPASDSSAAPKDPQAADRRDGTTRRAASATPEEIARLRDEEATLTAQLSRPRVPVSPESRRAEENLRARIEQMRLEYEHLVNAYTDSHPDVIRKGRDLESARQDLRRLEAAHADSEKARAATSALDEEVARAARARLDEVRANLAAAGAPPSRSGGRGRRLSQRASVAESDLDPEMRRVGQDSKLSELLRRYETTRDVYQDLLKKREAARLSLNLDVERSNVILKVQEPPAMPVIASGLRVMHKSIIGLVLALAVPLGLLVAMISFDGRVRGADQIERYAKVPVLVSIPFALSAEEQGRMRMHKVLTFILLSCVLAAYAVAYFLNQTKVSG